MKKKVLLSSIATIALCVCLIAGSTFALFTSTSKTDISVTAGDVDVTSSVQNFKRYSVKKNPAGTIIDEQGGRYKYAECPGVQFANGGTAELDGSVITLKNATPGDKVAFGIEATNNSNVMIQCRYVIECVGDETLMSGLIVYINGNAYPMLKSFTSAWVELGEGESITDNGNIKIEVELPVTAGNEYEKQATKINVVVEAVQGNADLGATNTDKVKFLPGFNATIATDRDSLQQALDNAVAGDNFIVVHGDITGDVVATQKPDVVTTIFGNGHTFAGVLLVDGKSATYTTAGLTVQNFVFKADSISADACIRLGDGTNATRYTCNVSVVGCTFDVPDAVGVKSYTGGDKNTSIISCTATARAHSLAQLKGVDGVLVAYCDVKSVRGLNFNNSLDVVVDGCVIDVQRYAIRFGESGNSIVENFAVTNCTLTSQNAEGDAAIVLRAGATNAILDLTDTTINAGIEITR